MQRAPLSLDAPVALSLVEYIIATGQIRLTFTRPVNAGTVVANSYRVTGANAAVRNVQGAAFASGLTVLRSSTGIPTPTAPAVSTFTAGSTPFIDSDGNVLAPWSNFPVTLV